MSHWSTHRLILLLHKYYNVRDDIKGSRALLDGAYFRPPMRLLLLDFCSFGNWAEPAARETFRSVVLELCPLAFLILCSFLATVHASSPRRRDGDLGAEKIGEELEYSDLYPRQRLLDPRSVEILRVCALL